MSTIRTKNIPLKIERESPDKPSKAVAAFTLVELLTVIAVIAILTAIIFPVFNSAREKARQGTAISNMRQIQNAVEKYKLDHRGQYPPVLFAYSDGSSTMSGIKAAGPAYLKGLYPQYINDASVFTDPNNKVQDTGSNKTVSAYVNTLGPDGTLAKSTSMMTFFQADAYDISPQMVAPGNLSTSVYVPRYQTAWTSMPAPSGAGQRQLALPTSTDDTYMTMTTYHVQGFDKVIVLFKNGTTKVFDTSRVLSPGCGDVTDISAASGVSPAKFWQIQPTGSCP